MPSQSTSYQNQHIAAKSPPAFEFPKRKRWADLLLTELVDNIAFVISPACKIWFCGAPVTDLLGWRDTDIIDLDFMDLLDVGDHVRFRESFNQAIQHGVEFDLVIKLKKCESPIAFGVPVPTPGIIFNIKCYPYIAEPEPEIKCLIAMATPYPSRSTSILDTIIDLKARQNRLRHRLAELQARAPLDTSSNSGSSSQANSMYATSSLNAKNHGTGVSVPGSDTFLSSGMGGKSMNDPSMRGFLDTNEFNSEEPIDEGSKKKKQKRAQNAEQYVCKTCGRTDSPEWRKGPMGPKTLCNACGLRWAKQMRKDPTEETGPLNALADI